MTIVHLSRQLQLWTGLWQLLDHDAQCCGVLQNMGWAGQQERALSSLMAWKEKKERIGWMIDLLIKYGLVMPSGDIDLGQHWLGVMAYCLTAPSHYLNQYWLNIIRNVPWHSPYIYKYIYGNTWKWLPWQFNEMTTIQFFSWHLWQQRVKFPGNSRFMIRLLSRCTLFLYFSSLVSV